MKLLNKSGRRQPDTASKRSTNHPGTLLNWFYPWRGVLFGLLFLVYIYVIHPMLLSIVVDARTRGETYYLLGTLIVLIQAAELAGVWLKWPMVSERIRRWPNPSFIAKFAVGVAQLSHIFLSMMVFLHVMPLFGVSGMCFDYENQLSVCLLTNLAFFAILGKELVVFILVLNDKEPAVIPDLHAPLIQLRELMGEVILLAFGMVTFSMSWSALLAFIEPVQTGEWWMSLFSSSLLFLMLYPPSRLVFFAEEWLIRQSRFNRILSVLFFVSTMVVAIMEVPGMW